LKDNSPNKKTRLLPMDGTRLCYLLFFLSGATGLIYEILWVRLLERVLGSSPQAVAIVLICFMAGLALGSFLGGRWADRVNRRERLFLTYGVMEALVGIWAILIPILAILIQPLLSFLYNLSWRPSYYLGCLVVAVILILPATTLMGATLPVLIRFINQLPEALSLRSGTLYGLNTLGAAVGSIYCGFISIPKFGVNKTLFFAVLLNLSIFLIVYTTVKKGYFWGGFPSKVLGETERKTYPFDRLPFVLALLFFMSGMCALAFEIIWTNLLGLLIGPTTYSFTLVVSTFIIGIGLGSVIFGKIQGRISSDISFLIILNLVMAFSFLVISNIIGNLQFFYSKLIFSLKENLVLMWLIKGLILFVLMLPPTLLSGAMFPLCLKIAKPELSTLGKVSGFLYAANSIGCIVGSLIVGFFLLPFFGKIFSIKLLAFFQILVSLGCAFFLFKRSVLRHKALISVALVCIIFAFILPKWDLSLLAYGRYHNFAELSGALQKAGWIQSIFSGNKILRAFEGPREVVYAGDGLTGFTVVQRYVDSIGKERLSLITSGKPDASSHGDRATQCLLAHIPMLFHPSPKSVMVLGLASGMTAGEVLHYPIESLDVLEISKQVLEASSFFTSYNNDLFKDKRVNIILQDGRVHLTHTKTNYDVIISEPSNPWMAGLANLFSLEFFEYGKKRLKEGGIFLQWIHSYEMDWETFSLICNTFFKIFKNGAIFRTSPYGDDYLLLGFKDKKDLSVEALEKNLDFAKNSSLISIKHPSVIKELIISDEPKRIFSDGLIHTDSNPILEFRAPKLLYRSSEDVGSILQEKAHPTILHKKYQNQPLADLFYFDFSLSVFQPYFEPTRKMTKEQLEKANEMMVSYCKANLVVDIYSIPMENIRISCAKEQERLIGEHLKKYPKDWAAHVDLGNMLYILGDTKGYLLEMEKAFKLNPYTTEPFKIMGANAIREQKWEEALRHLEMALALDSLDPIIYFNLGLAYFNMDDLKKAKEYLSKGLKIRDNVMAKELLEEINRLIKRK